MFTDTVLLLCYICLRGFIATLRISLLLMLWWKRGFECICSHVPRSLKGETFEHSFTWLALFRAELSRWRSTSRKMSRSPGDEQIPGSSPTWAAFIGWKYRYRRVNKYRTALLSTLALSTFLPSFLSSFLPSFYPSVFPFILFLSRSLSHSLSLASFFSSL